jgi:ADP-ribose pyrophosphatase YjhB (NUDIX family)
LAAGLPHTSARSAGYETAYLQAVKRVHLAHGMLERDGRLLLVASRYPNHAEVLWNLPGGRQREGELLDETLRREFMEEVGLPIEVLGLRYVAESYDTVAGTHFTSVIFSVASEGAPVVSLDDVHVVACDFVPFSALRERLTVRVVRLPLLEHIKDPRKRYFGYAEADITIEFSDEP